MALPFLLQMLNGDFEKAVNADNEAEFERHKSVMTEKLAQSIGKRNAEAYVLRLNALLDEKRYDVLLQQPARAGRAVGGLVDTLTDQPARAGRAVDGLVEAVGEQGARAGKAIGNLVDYLGESGRDPSRRPDENDDLDPPTGAEGRRRAEMARLKARLKKLQEGPGGAFSRAGRALGGLLSGRSESKE